MSCGTPLAIGFRHWSGIRDNEGHREYRIVHRVHVDNTATIQDGPANTLSAVGLPLPGSTWIFGGDIDIQAICQWDAKMTPVVEEGERTKYFDVEQLFSTRPKIKCNFVLGTGTGNPATDPLAELPVISGSFIKYTEEKTVDRFLVDITNSAWERLRGPQVEFDASRLTIRILINEETLDLPTKLSIIDTVNDAELWGFEARTVKLSNITWEQKFTAECDCYYAVTYEFEMSPTGFDREVLDEGTKALSGKWNTTTGVWELIDINGGAPNPDDPTHFVRVTDFHGNYMRVILDGAGKPSPNNGTTEPGKILIEYYTEVPFATYITGLPETLDCPVAV
jgi:hypothetical protein